MFRPAGAWFTAKRTAPRVWTTSIKTGPTSGRRVCARGWQGAISRRWEGPMEFEDRALPLTRGQLDIWLAEETGRFGAKYQLGLLARIEGAVEPGLLERAV